MKNLLLLAFLIVSSYSCQDKTTRVQPVDKLAYPNVAVLLNNLYHLSDSGIMFGHQDDLAYGVGWSFEPGRSDIYETTGSLPAVFGWDLGNLGLGAEKNLDGIPFDQMQEYITEIYQKGGINTVSWHACNPLNQKDSWSDNDNVNPVVSQIIPGQPYHNAYIAMLDHLADFFLSLHIAKNEPIPIIFRPFHESNGDWFWWGEKHCTPEEYKTLFQFTVDYLRNTRGVHNLLYAYSPDQDFETKEEYLERYPGDRYVDIIGNDNYWDFNPRGGGLKAVSKKLEIITKLAEKRKKVAAMTETGYESVKDTSWFTNRLYKAITDTSYDIRISYVLVWRNFNEKHYYAPHPNHPAAEDFKQFKAKDDVFFLDELPDMYLR